MSDLPKSRSFSGLQQGGARRFVSVMLIFVERRRQFERVLFELRGQGLRREQLHVAVVQQLDDALDLERGRATGKLAFFTAFFDRDACDAVGADKRSKLGREGFDLSGVFIVVEGDFFGAEGHVFHPVLAFMGQGEDGFAAFDIDAANSHKKPGQ